MSSNHDIRLTTVPPVMDTIVRQTYVIPAKIDLSKLDDDSAHQEQMASPTRQAAAAATTTTATEHLAERTAQMLDDIRK